METIKAKLIQFTNIYFYNLMQKKNKEIITKVFLISKKIKEFSENDVILDLLMDTFELTFRWEQLTGYFTFYDLRKTAKASVPI